MDKTYKAPTVTKAFEILDLLSRSGQSLTLSDLSRRLGISKSTAHGIISALESAGAVARDDKTRRLGLGLALFELGSAMYARLDLAAVARSFLEDLREKTGESVFLGARSGEHVSILDVAESAKELKITAPVGTRIPLVAGATGKVLLAAMPDEQAAALVREKGLRGYTGNTITDPARYLEELCAVRRNGYAIDNEEYIQGVRAVAAPVRSGGQRVSAIWVVGFTPSMSDEKIAATVAETRRIAEAVERRLDERSIASKGGHL